jgi:hypothetical protein
MCQCRVGALRSGIATARLLLTRCAGFIRLHSIGGLAGACGRVGRLRSVGDWHGALSQLTRSRIKPSPKGTRPNVVLARFGCVSDRPLHYGISESGQKRPRASARADRACPLRPKSGQTGRRFTNSALCQRQTSRPAEVLFSHISKLLGSVSNIIDSLAVAAPVLR